RVGGETRNAGNERPPDSVPGHGRGVRLHGGVDARPDAKRIRCGDGADHWGRRVSLIMEGGGTSRKESLMRYLVTARVRPGREADLLKAIEKRYLGAGSVAGDEYLRNMTDARLREDGSVRWVEVCFCNTPLEEERPYWEEYFELVMVQDAHHRDKCRDLNGEEPWACSDCDCTAKLESHLAGTGQSFLQLLRETANHA